MLPTAPAADVPVLVLYEQAVSGADTVQKLLAFLGAMGDPHASFEDPNDESRGLRPGLVGMFRAEQAFERAYDHDAHFVQYGLFETDGTPCSRGWPRINKELAPILAAKGAHLRQTFVGVDLDTKGHAKWSTDGVTEPAPEVYVPNLITALSRDPILTNWWAFYLTAKGARLIYRLAAPVSFMDVEGHIRGLLNRLVATGVTIEAGTFEVDFKGSSDWTRLLRLPRVVRADDGADLRQSEIAFQPERRLDLLTIPAASKPSPTIAAEKYHGLMPAEDDVEIDHASDGKLADWRRVALRTLGDSEPGMVAAGKRQLVENGGQGPSGRNDAILRVAGSAVARLYQLSLDPESAVKQQTSPEAIYGLLFPAVKQFAPDETSRLSWPQVLWSAVVRMWDKEASKFAHLARKVEEEKAQTNLSIVEGFARWCDDPLFLSAASESEKLEFIKKQLVVAVGKGNFFVLRGDGYYRHDSVSKDLLISTMRREGLDKIIDFEWTTTNAKGESAKGELTELAVFRRHSMAVSVIEGQPMSDDLPGGKILTYGREKTLIVPIFGLRTDIQPEFNAEVDGWLRSFGHDELFEYIQKALDFTTPIPLSAIIGPPSIGKQLIVRGLSECVTTQAMATDKDFGTFGAGLMRSPFLLINEDIEERIGGTEISAMIRRVTAGDALDVNRKHRDPIAVNNAMRVIVTANNPEVLLKLLGQDKDLSPDDRDALTMRVVHLPTTDAPARYLERLGGFDFTGKEGARWVRAVNGAKSDFVVAKHFLWIKQQQQYGPNKDGRFSMKGKLPHEMLFALSTGGSSSAVVVKALLGMIEAAALASRNLYGFVVPAGSDRIFVTAHEVQTFYENVYQDKTKKTLNVKQVGKALQGLRAPGSSNEPRFIAERKDKKNRWNEILLSTLLTAGTEHGYKTDNLIKLAKAAGVPVESGEFSGLTSEALVLQGSS